MYVPPTVNDLQKILGNDNSAGLVEEKPILVGGRMPGKCLLSADRENTELHRRKRVRVRKLEHRLKLLKKNGQRDSVDYKRVEARLDELEALFKDL